MKFLHKYPHVSISNISTAIAITLKNLSIKQFTFYLLCYLAELLDERVLMNLDKSRRL